MKIEKTYDDKEFELIPEGKYNVRVDEIEIRETQKGDEYLNWTFLVIEGDYEGRKLYFITSLKDSALWKLNDILGGVFNIPQEKGSVNFDTDDLIGRKCQVSVFHDSYRFVNVDGIEQQRTIAKVKDLYPLIEVEDELKSI